MNKTIVILYNPTRKLWIEYLGKEEFELQKEFISRDESLCFATLLGSKNHVNITMSNIKKLTYEYKLVFIRQVLTEKCQFS